MRSESRSCINPEKTKNQEKESQNLRTIRERTAKDLFKTCEEDPVLFYPLLKNKDFSTQIKTWKLFCLLDEISDKAFTQKVKREYYNLIDNGKEPLEAVNRCFDMIKEKDKSEDKKEE